MKELDVLKNLGLTKYEAAVYLVLLKLGKATVGEICKESNTPRPRVYDTLESLERKGFVMRYAEKPVMYSAVPPEIALNVFKDRIFQELSEKIELAKKELSKMEQSPPPTNIQVIKNTGLFLKKVEQLASKGDTVIVPETYREMIKNLPEHTEFVKSDHAILIDDHVLFPLGNEHYLWIKSREFRDKIIDLMKK